MTAPVREDTISEKAVLLSLLGLKPKRIAVLLGTSSQCIRVLLYRRKHCKIQLVGNYADKLAYAGSLHKQLKIQLELGLNWRQGE